MPRSQQLPWQQLKHLDVFILSFFFQQDAFFLSQQKPRLRQQLQLNLQLLSEQPLLLPPLKLYCKQPQQLKLLLEKQLVQLIERKNRKKSTF